MTGTQFEWLALEEFLERPPLSLGSVLLSIKIPCLEINKSESSDQRNRFLFETYRASPRPLGNALPYLNAAFLVKVSSCKDSGGTMIDTCRLSFGAYGTKHAIRAKNVEEFLAGKLLSFFIPLIESPAGITNGDEYHPIGKPIRKSGAALQASDTQKLADMAANSAIVDYDIENLEALILSVEDAVKRSSFFEVPPFLCPKQVGDVSKGMAEADHKILSAEVHGIYLLFSFVSPPLSFHTFVIIYLGV
ncbi:CO dehydrogenase flavoprotein, C-terminal [Sesbania bispinosa]|nr:CO dehydrogenase flavoprotein, C-terminal [Sesbania bispinosa]